MSESGAQVALRLLASRSGARLWRNNVGAGYLKDGTFCRWGLANESRQQNLVLKSGDLIGIRPVLITPDMVGTYIGRFVSREVKHPGWHYHPNDPHEQAQQAWADLVTSLGGDAGFSTGEWK